MAKVRVKCNIVLESVLGISFGHVLDFSNDSFATFFDNPGIDMDDAERYSGFGNSKVNRLRALRRNGTKDELRKSLHATIK